MAADQSDAESSQSTQSDPAPADDAAPHLQADRSGATDPTAETVHIDGSTGVGGGQVLRTSLALACCTGRTLEMTEIRAGRSKPGLRAQHLTCVHAAAAVCNAEVEGAAIGARELRFDPGPIEHGTYEFDIGTAGSSTLVLQTVLPPLMTAASPSEVVVRGGTHNSAAPTFEFLERSFLPVLEQMGVRVDLELVRAGFYPRGGGEIRARIHPTPTLTPLTLLERGPSLRQSATAIVSQLPKHIAHRELNVLRQMLGIEGPAEEDGGNVHVVVADSPGPGNVCFVELEFEHVTAIFTGFGQRGIRAEAVARGAAARADDYLMNAIDAPVEPHLADQLLVPMALAGGDRFRTLTPTPHARTNAEIIERFLPVEIAFREIAAPDGYEVVVGERL